MVSPNRPRRTGVWLLAVGSLVTFLGVRMLSVSYGALVAFYADAWTVDGVRVQVLDEEVGGLAAGDVVTGVAGRPIGAWIDGVLDPGLD